MQTVLFEDLEKEINLLRVDFCKNANKYFTINEVSIFERLVFDLTHKDFEYFICYILNKEKYLNINVTDEKFDKMWIDIIAEKDWIIHLFQCKQWSSKYFDIKKVGESYAKLFTVKEEYFENAKLHFVTTSYLDINSQEFLWIHGVELISSRKLIDYALKYMLQKSKNWEELIQFIQYKRIGKMLGEYHQKRLFSNINNIKQKLWQQRLNESAMHSRNYRIWVCVKEPVFKSVIFNNFSQGWKLTEK